MNILAPAKINIYLKVGEKRPDGYHELKTLMVPIDICDEISITPTEQGTNLNTIGHEVPLEENLVYKAARLFFETSGIKKGASIKLKKNIPVGAGLGGGSSDAACTLYTMNELFNAGLTEKELISMAAKLGADCPFFIFKRPMIMIERGDVPFKEIEIEERAFLLVIPPFGVPTSEVYSKFAPLTTRGDTLNIYTIHRIRPEDWLKNDLERVVFDMHPELAEIKKQLIASGALGALMSGSGSTVFGIFNNHEHLLNAMSCIKKIEGYRYIPTSRFDKGGIAWRSPR